MVGYKLPLETPVEEVEKILDKWDVWDVYITWDWRGYRRYFILHIDVYNKKAYIYIPPHVPKEIIERFERKIREYLMKRILERKIKVGVFPKNVPVEMTVKEYVDLTAKLRVYAFYLNPAPSYFNEFVDAVIWKNKKGWYSEIRSDLFWKLKEFGLVVRKTP